jgi:hypothetical protein
MISIACAVDKHVRQRSGCAVWNVTKKALIAFRATFQQKLHCLPAKLLTETAQSIHKKFVTASPQVKI